jgi:hypothetical protein
MRSSTAKCHAISRIAAGQAWEEDRAHSLIHFAMVCNPPRTLDSNRSRGYINSVMKRCFQIVAATMLLMFFGASGADCLVPNAGMSDTEKACCQQRAGQCEMSMAAKHPCCQKIAQHDDADLYDLSHFASPPLSLHVAMLGVGSSVDIATPSFFLPERLGRPPHDPPTPSVEILRI